MILLNKEYISPLVKKRDPESHKGDYGHALLISGSKGKMGAAVLASRACLRAGAGLLTTHIPFCGVNILQESIPEAMVSIDSNEGYFSDLLNVKLFDAVGIGPGIGKDASTQKALAYLLKHSGKPLVIDADALNILSLNKVWFSLIPKNSILTPHNREFERMAGKWESEEQKTELQLSFSKMYDCVLVLKGPGTTITTPDGTIFKNTTGNPGMAKGGSGDALTGMITSFLAQGYSSVEAAQIGVFIHGLAGDLAVREFSEYGLLTSDLIEFIPKAFKSVLAD